MITQNIAITAYCYRRAKERGQRPSERVRKSVCHNIKVIFKGTWSEWWNQSPAKPSFSRHQLLFIHYVRGGRWPSRALTNLFFSPIISIIQAVSLSFVVLSSSYYTATSLCFLHLTMENKRRRKKERRENNNGISAGNQNWTLMVFNEIKFDIKAAK